MERCPHRTTLSPVFQLQSSFYAVASIRRRDICQLGELFASNDEIQEDLRVKAAEISCILVEALSNSMESKASIILWDTKVGDMVSAWKMYGASDQARGLYLCSGTTITGLEKAIRL